MAHGKDLYFALDDTGGTLRDLSTYLTSCELGRQADLAENSTVGLEAKTFEKGLYGWTIKLNGKYDKTATSGPAIVLQALVDFDSPTDIEWGPGGNGAGAANLKRTGQAFVVGYVETGGVGSIMTFTADLTGNGALTDGTFA